MNKLESILSSWAEDSKIDKTEPGRELLNIPILHNKYLSDLSAHRMASKGASFEYTKKKLLKQKYYSGKLSEEELEENGWEPFRYTLKSDISLYIEGDEDLIKILKKKAYHDEAVAVLESILQELKSRTFQLRDYISYEKFIQGA